MSTLLYNPDRKDKQQFIEEFVVRTDIFDEIFADLKSSDAKYPEQNYLLIGQRGLGKTTLLTRLKYAIEDDSELKKWLIPVSFSEEQYNISELANLWEDVAIYLEDYHGYTGLSEAMQQYARLEHYEQTAFDLLIKKLDESKKKVVLLIDNIGSMLSKFEEQEVRRLREILQTKSHIRIIAVSTTVLESITDYHQPLYEFFKVFQLKGLTIEECIRLLKKLAVINGESEKIDRIITEGPRRVETIRTLSGGVPRTIAMLFQVFLDNEHGSSVSDLEKILDLVTPLYKHRMDDLPTQQQKIVDAVAKNWDAVTVKELAERLRLDSKLISAQLRQLEKSQVIEKRNTKTKNHLYLLSERFFNIWYLMRYGRKENRQRVIWLVKFLETWCDTKEIEKRIDNYVAKMKAGTLDDSTSKVWGEIYSFFDKINANCKFILKESTPEYISKQIAMIEEDVSALIDQAIEAEDWDKLIKVGEQYGDITVSQKNNMLQLSVSDEYIVKSLAYFDKKFNSGSFHRFTSFDRICYFLGINAVIGAAVFSKKMDLLEKSIEAVCWIYNNDHQNFEEPEAILFSQIINTLHIGNLNNKVLDMFNKLENFDKEIKSKYKVVYYATLKLLDRDISQLDLFLLEEIDKYLISIQKLQKDLSHAQDSAKHLVLK